MADTQSGEFGRTIHSGAPLAGGDAIFEGRYILESIVGRGGMGEVWSAEDTKLDQRVALKFLPEILRLDVEAVSQLKREAERGRPLCHSGIVAIYDFFEDAKHAAICMEFVDGDSLSARKVSQPAGCFDVEEIRAWIDQICEAVGYAHEEQGIVHRDLKPGNILIDRHDAVRVLDFGLSRALSDSMTRLSREVFTGASFGYASPQQMRGKRPGISDDIYGIGATIYDLITGTPPFHSGDIYSQTLHEPPPPMAERRKEFEIKGKREIPGEWETAVSACLAKEPGHRPESVRAIREIIAGGPVVTAGRPIRGNASRRKKTPSGTGKRTLIAGLGCAAVLALGAVIWQATGPVDDGAAASDPARDNLAGIEEIAVAEEEKPGGDPTVEQDSSDAVSSNEKKEPVPEEETKIAVTPVKVEPPPPPPPDPQVESWLREARTAKGDEKWLEADKLYEKVLDRNPANEEAIAGRRSVADRSSIELFGSPTYQIDAENRIVTFGVPKIENVGTAMSGSLEVTMWAGSHQFGSVLFDPLESGRDYDARQVKTDYSAPENGTYDVFFRLHERRSGRMIQINEQRIGSRKFFTKPLQVIGTYSWQSDPDLLSMSISISEIRNMRSRTSGSIRAELWATDEPYRLGSKGHQIARLDLSPLAVGNSYRNISEQTRYTPPPDGRYHVALLVLENGTVVDYTPTSGAHTFATKWLGFKGMTYCETFPLAGTARISFDEIVNRRNATTGSLRLQLWAFNSPYAGKDKQGHLVATLNLPQLLPVHSHQKIDQLVRANQAPRATRYLTLILSEYQGSGYVSIDYINIAAQRR